MITKEEIEKAAKQFATIIDPVYNNHFQSQIEYHSFKAGANWEAERAKVLVDALMLLKDQCEELDLMADGGSSSEMVPMLWDNIKKTVNRTLKHYQGEDNG